MPYATSKPQRSSRSSFKSQLSSQPSNDSYCYSSDSSFSSNKNMMSAGAMFGTTQKLSKREKIKSLFSHPKPKRVCLSSDSSISSDEDVLSVITVSSQSQKLSKREKFKSIFSHSKPTQDSTASTSSISTDEDVLSVVTISSQNQEMSKREKLKTFFSHPKPSQSHHSSSSSNSTVEDIASVESITSQNQKLSKREQFKAYFRQSNSVHCTASDSSTIYEEDPDCYRIIHKQLAKERKRETLKTVFNIKRSALKSPVKGNSPPYEYVLPAELNTFQKIISHFRRYDDLEEKAKRKRKFYLACGAAPLASSAVVAITAVSSASLLPLVLPVAVPIAVVSAAILLIKCYKLTREPNVGFIDVIDDIKILFRNYYYRLLNAFDDFLDGPAPPTPPAVKEEVVYDPKSFQPVFYDSDVSFIDVNCDTRRSYSSSEHSENPLAYSYRSKAVYTVLPRSLCTVHQLFDIGKLG